MQEEWTTKKVDKYILVNKKLGSGVYGVVYRGFLAEDEKFQVAVKTIPIKLIQNSSKMLELIKREIGILQKINHPNIVKLYDVARTSNYLYMFLEYCKDGDLKEYLLKKEDKTLSESEAISFLKQIVDGFQKLYKIKIIHRDIKPANILLNDGVAKITDFGFARMIETEMNDPAYLSRLGSPLYMAPQILEGQPFSAKCDVWSVGIMFYEMLYGQTPWNGENQYNLLENIKKSELKFPSKPHRSQRVKDLISQLLRVNEKDRLSWDLIFNHAVFENNEKLDQFFGQSKEEINSLDINRNYLEKNLVIGYLANETIEDSRDKSIQESNTFSNKSNLSQNTSQQNKDLDVFINLEQLFLLQKGNCNIKQLQIRVKKEGNVDQIQPIFFV